MNKLMCFRDSQVKRLVDNPKLLIGDVTTVNLTKMSGGKVLRSYNLIRIQTPFF